MSDDKLTGKEKAGLVCFELFSIPAGVIGCVVMFLIPLIVVVLVWGFGIELLRAIFK